MRREGMRREARGDVGAQRICARTGSEGNGAYRSRFFGKPLHSFSHSGLQEAQTPPSPLVGEGGWGDEGQKRTGMQQTAHLSQELDL
jgi:hypothetical protein